MTLQRLSLLLCLACAWIAPAALATSNYQYGPDEYVTIANGLSPDGALAITTHGQGEDGYTNFHVYLTNAVTGKKIGPLEEIVDSLDTGADAFCARWIREAGNVIIVYRVDRHAPLKGVTYHLADGRARLVKGPFDVTAPALIKFWQEQCSTSRPSKKVFGTPIRH